MRGRLLWRLIFGILLIFQLPVCLATETSDPNDSSKYLSAVREFADNVLKHGRDTYGPKHTPLFVDGLNIHTHEPVKWISPKGDYSTATDTEEWILCNFASQQTLMRTLDGLSQITGDSTYRDAAMRAMRYAFEHLQAPNGLLYWGHETAYDALEDRVRGGRGHTLKLHYPYYELMWTVDPNATKKFIEAYWSAHILDWSNLDMDRGSLIVKRYKEPWNHEYKPGPPFFKGGNCVISTGSSLMHAGIILCRHSGQDQPLIWSKRLAKRFVDTRHPKTGISARSYTSSWDQIPWGRLKEHFVDPYITIFPYCLPKASYFYYPERTDAQPWIAFLLIGEMLGEQGREFTQWALEELTAWGKVAYRKEDNSFIPMLTDGTSLEGYVFKEHTYFGPKGTSFRPYFADLTFFWAYTTAYRTTGDEFMWEMARNIALGNNFGDIGQTLGETPKLRTNTTCSHVYALVGFLELYAETKKSAYLEMARRIGDNILVKGFHKGFFVPSKKHIYTRFDCFEPLALLHLDAAMKSKIGSVPRIWPSSPLFIPPYRYKQKPTDRQIIYRLTELSEPPMSLQEAAAIGDIDLLRSLIEKGADIDGREDPVFKTALHRAVIGGHKDVAELLLAKGADVSARDLVPFATPLHYAAEKGHKEIAEMLIAKGADANARNLDSSTPLAMAVSGGHIDVVKFLIDKGADVNLGNKLKWTPLHKAADDGQKSIVELLIAKGADVNVKSHWDETVLHAACWSGYADVAELLVAKGADVNAKDKSEYTPLYYAVENEDLDLVRLLVEHGAKLDVKCQDGWTAFRYAAAQGNRELVEFFVSKGADVSSFHMAACVGDLTRVGRFCDEGTDVNVRDEFGWTPLYWAASTGQKNVAEYLLAKGANVIAKTNDNRTPLHQAARAGARELAELLIVNGADVNAKDKEGRTPVWYAQKRGHAEIVELLRKHGAKE